MKIETSGTTYFPKINQVTSFLSKKIATVARAFFDALTRLYEFFFKKAPAEKTVKAVGITPNSNPGSAVSSADTVAEITLGGSLPLDAEAVEGSPRSNPAPLALHVGGKEDEEEASIDNEDPALTAESTEGSVVAVRGGSLDGSQLPASEAVGGSPRSNSPPSPLDVVVEDEVEDHAPIVHVDPAQAIVSAENKEKMKGHIKEAAGVIKQAMLGMRTKALRDWYQKNTNLELPKDEQLPATHEMVLLIKALINDGDQGLKKEIKDVLFIIYDSGWLDIASKAALAKDNAPYKDFIVFKQEFFGPQELEQSFHRSGITEDKMKQLHNHFMKQKFKAMCQGLFPELPIK